MRWVSLILISLLLLLQYPLWFGKGGWLKVWDLDRQVEEQKHINQKIQTRNAVLDAEVRDLKQGTEAVEERARSELGMVKRDEVFFQIVDDHSLLPASAVLDVKAASGVHPK
ncbi:cell division protein FtsB [Candidatus Nitrotoga sp. 1052]|uniref:cell division protein FtsB n=1 Tax=Candidatus Nitrotoga sp. 1052 TaxID=2886964 RepID=UPI001EF456CA|nr:cell division protein FtsB [Candidatus Nitrotoga sp. 1052]CAH1091581.1 Cell division protein FtsB [Candidatus Nitrotoga sp. 1052]